MSQYPGNINYGYGGQAPYDPNMQYNAGVNHQYVNSQYDQQGYPQQQYQQGGEYEVEDYDNLDEIEQELYGKQPSNDADEYFEQEFPPDSPVSRSHKGHGAAHAAMPTQNGKLSQFANEFWFPENRECACCKGYKHGCQCCKSGVDTCTHSTCTVIGAPQAPVEVRTASNPVSRPVGANPSSVSTSDKDIPCRFEAMPGGCKFGSTCRFKHTTGGGSSSGSSYQLPPQSPTHNNAGAPIKCMFFGRGYCQFGDKCRFSHTL